MEIKHYVTYYNAINHKTKEVRSNELVDLRIPSDAIAFKTFDRVTSNLYRDGVKVVATEDKLNEKTYCIGKAVSLDEVKIEYGVHSREYRELIKNKNYGAVQTKDKYLFPLSLNEKVHILAPEKVGLICYFDDDSEMICQ